MILQVCRKLNFPEESLPVLEDAYRKILATPETAQLLDSARESLLEPGCTEFLDLMTKVTEKTGIHPKTANLVLQLYTVAPLQEIYAQNGLSEKLFWDTMEDLRYKLYECKRTYKVWGSSSAGWQKLFFELKCFKIGRLEYEPTLHFCEVSYKGIKKGDPTILIHIPSDGPLYMDAVMESLKMAYEFFKDQFPDGIVPYVTETWLLYPPYMEEGVFPKEGNVQKFAALFHILQQDADELNRNFSAVYGCKYGDADFDKLPQETALQRNLLAYLRQGNPMGRAYGIFFYGENGIIG